MKNAACILFLIIGSFLSVGTLAEQTNDLDVKDLSALIEKLTEPQKKACVFNNAVYSVGAILHQKDITIQCVFQSHTSNGLTPGAKWEILGR